MFWSSWMFADPYHSNYAINWIKTKLIRKIGLKLCNKGIVKNPNRQFVSENYQPKKSLPVSILEYIYFPDASFGIKSIPFQSVHLRFISIDYEWMRNLFPTHGLIRSESPNDSVRLRFILFQSELMSQVYSAWFGTNQNKILIPFESV